MKELQEYESNTAIVRTSNRLIESIQNLNVHEKRLILVLISQLDTNLVTFEDKFFYIDILEYKKLLGHKDKNFFSVVWKNARSLRKKEVFLKGKNGDIDTVSWIDTVRAKQKQGLIGLRIHTDMEQFLLWLKMKVENKYTLIYLNNIIRLNNIHSIRLYELLKQYAPKIKKREFAPEKLRQLLGIDIHKYPRYSNFKQRVLNPRIKEINEKTDIIVKLLTPSKKGQKVTKIIFETILKNSKVENHRFTELLKQIPEKDRKEAEELARKIYDDKGDEQLEFYINYTNKRPEVGNGNYAGYLNTCYSRNIYHVEINKENKKLEELEKLEEVVKLKKQKEEDENLRAKYAIYLKDKQIKHRDSLSEKDFSVIDEKINNDLEKEEIPNRQALKYKKLSLESKYIFENFDVVEFEDWKKQQFAGAN